MGSIIQFIIFVLVVTYMSISHISGAADAKNSTYLENAATTAILKAPPAGYITPQIQEELRTYLKETRGMDPAQIVIEGTTNISQRKVKNSGDETIELKIRYPRKTILFFDGVKESEYKPKRTIKTEYTGS
ncbi:hypothetical protein [Paenibacillus elgii]|uniref:hypothetical protein n=1 Tax=Paenibacillus elgii TaxID=189691 RepID=UPI0013D49054|nr:hypothetical protein [Paenibacillus elgii]